jgi:tetratricopeptide (TPR) repeat protein
MAQRSGIDGLRFFSTITGLFVMLVLSGCLTTSPPGTRDIQILSQVNSLITRGSKLANEGKYDQAIETLNKAVKLNPDAAGQQNAYSWRGYCYLLKGSYEQALADLDRHVKAHPSDAGGYILRGDARRAMGNVSQALVDYDRVVELAHNPEAYYRRGTTHGDLKQWKEAIADLTRFLDMPEAQKLGRAVLWDWQADAHWYRGLAEYNLGQTEAARADAQRARNMMPRRSSAFTDENILDYLDLDKRTKIAAEALAAAAKVEAEGSLLTAFQMYQRAYAWGPSRGEVADKSTEGMMRLYPKLTPQPVVPEEVLRLAAQADTAASGQNYSEAVTLYGRALDAAPWWPKGRYNDAMLKAKEDDFEGAIAEMQRYLALSPNAPDAQQTQDAINQWQHKQQSATPR